MDVAAHQVARLRDSGRSLSRNDVRIIVMAQLLCHLSHGDSAAAALRYLENETAESEVAITRLACTTDTLSRGQY
jgi:hypothetical protein